MGTPSIVKRDHGFISVGSIVSEGNPFTSELVADTGGVRFTFSFSEDIDVSVEVTRAYTTRFSEIYSTELGPGGTGPPLMFKAFSGAALCGPTTLRSMKRPATTACRPSGRL